MSPRRSILIPLLLGLSFWVPSTTLQAQDTTSITSPIEIGLMGGMLMLPEGNLKAPNYVNSGAYQHVGEPVENWDMPSMESRWAVSTDNMKYIGLWAAYRLDDQWAIRLSLRYGLGIKFTSMATV